jgi:chemotaxis protein CheZ
MDEQEQNVISEDNLARVQDLLVCMEKGDEAGAREIVDDLTQVRETTLYQEVGKLTRELHDAISAFGMDDRISDLAEHEIPDARERLNYVITKTDEAANRTLTAIEETIPVFNDFEKQAEVMSAAWQRFVNKEMSADEFRALAKQLGDFLTDIPVASVKVREQFNEVLMAQDFQDLTGQIIKKVITLVGEVENNLVNLIKVAGLPEQQQQADEHEKEKLSGPPVPGVDKGNIVSGQDEVDDLLSSLGF